MEREGGDVGKEEILKTPGRERVVERKEGRERIGGVLEREGE